MAKPLWRSVTIRSVVAEIAGMTDAVAVVVKEEVRVDQVVAVEEENAEQVTEDNKLDKPY